MQVAGLVLAGGQARRLGGQDKALVRLGGKALVSYALAGLARSCTPVLISAAGDPARFAAFGAARVIADDLPGFQGPLAGILAGLDWLEREAPGVTHMLSLPVDTPFAPDDLAARLAVASKPDPARPATAASNGALHPAITLWPLAVRDALRVMVVEEEMRAVSKVLQRLGSRSVAWDHLPHDPFFNINNPADLADAEALLRQMSGGDD